MKGEEERVNATMGFDTRSTSDTMQMSANTIIKLRPKKMGDSHEYQ